MEVRRLSPEDRVAFFQKRCTDDPGVMAEVESLLEHDVLGFLEGPSDIRSKSGSGKTAEGPLRIPGKEVENVEGD